MFIALFIIAKIQKQPKCQMNKQIIKMWYILKMEYYRQTALQQEARIRADQDTIRELTGKLGRCESGLPRGLQDAGPRRDTMADGPWDSPALILELEDAVRALRDRIDRLEVSAAPRALPS